MKGVTLTALLGELCRKCPTPPVCPSPGLEEEEVMVLWFLNSASSPSRMGMLPPEAVLIFL